MNPRSPWGRGFLPLLRPSTIDVYRGRHRRVQAWCAERGEDAATPRGLAAYLVAHQDRAPATLAAYKTAVNRACHDRGVAISGHHSVPRRLVARLRALGAPARRAPVVDVPTFDRILQEVLHPSGGPQAAVSARGRAVVLVGLATHLPLRRLVLCRVADLSITTAGATLHVPRWKKHRDSHAEVTAGETYHVERRGDALDPVAALEELRASLPEGVTLLFGVVEDEHSGSLALRCQASPRLLYRRLWAQLQLAARRGGLESVPISPHLVAGWVDAQVETLLTELQPDCLTRVRTAALLTVQLALALRPEALTEIFLEEIRPTPAGGYRLFIRRDKTHPQGFFKTVVHTATCSIHCPACRLEALLALQQRRGISSGALFAAVAARSWSGKSLTSGGVGQIVEAAGAALDLRLTGHSMRRTAATQMDRNGATQKEGMDWLEHRTWEAHRLYVEPEEPSEPRDPL
jgi:hypothetical protein